VGVKASMQVSSVTAVLSYMCSGKVATTTLASRSLIPLAHHMSCWWYPFRCSSLSSNHHFIPRHYASCSAVSNSSMFAIIVMAQCRSASWRVFWCAMCSMLQLQTLRAQAVTGTCLSLLGIPFLFPSIGSIVSSTTVSTAMDITTVAISILRSIWALLF